MALLGGGHRYEVYLAFDSELHALVVAKLLRPHLVCDPVALEGLAAEARALEELAHPVLPRSFGAVTSGKRPHIVLEHLEGPRLSSLLRRHGRLAIEQAVPLGLQVASALVYMHNRGMVHLDVKPANVVMGAPPRLIDLSVARTADAARSATHPVGTDAYMAPEQCDPQGLGGMGSASDVWGLGATLYEAITGALPFPRDSELGPHPQLALEPAPPGPDVPAVLAELLMDCLAFDPAQRPTAVELAERLGELSAALPRRIVLSRLRPRLR
jgi:serine/threonine protein kinase